MHSALPCKTKDTENIKFLCIWGSIRKQSKYLRLELDFCRNLSNFPQAGVTHWYASPKTMDVLKFLFSKPHLLMQT